MSILEKIKDKVQPPCTWDTMDGDLMISKELSKLLKTLKRFNSCAYRMTMTERESYRGTIKIVETALREQKTKDRYIISRRIRQWSYKIRYKLYDLLGGEK